MTDTDIVTRRVVYLVTRGSYSDYSVDGVYSTRELAEKARVLMNTDNDVEEYDLDHMPECPPGLLPYRVRIERDGKAEVWRASAPLYDHSADMVPYSSARAGGMVTYMYARDEQHAVKIANERRIQVLASGEWMEDWTAWMAKRRAAKA